MLVIVNLILSSLQSWEAGTAVPYLQMGKLKLREGEQVDQQDLKPGLTWLDHCVLFQWHRGNPRSKASMSSCHIQTPGKLNYWLLVGSQRTMACFERWMSKGADAEGDSNLYQPLFNMGVCWQSAPFRSGWRKTGKLQHPRTSRATLLDRLINVSVCWLPHQRSLCTSYLLSTELNTGWWRQPETILAPLFQRWTSFLFPVLLTPLLVSPGTCEVFREDTVRIGKRAHHQFHLFLLQMLTSGIRKSP